MVQKYSNTQEIFDAAAALFYNAAQKAMESKGNFTVALTGGSSPITLHQLLASETYKDKIDWSKVFVFWGDERWLALDDELSNAKMAYETLLNHVAIPSSHIFPMYKDGIEPQEYAAEYENILREKLGDSGSLDFIFLGIGDDGHTASLFPGTAVLDEKEKWVDAYYLDAQQMYRITLTASFINKAKEIVVITFGDKKADALKEVINGEYNPDLYPSQLLKPADGKLVFLVDEKAAKYLT